MDSKLLYLVFLILASSYACYIGVPIAIYGMIKIFGKRGDKYSFMTKEMVLAVTVVNLPNLMIVLNEIIFHIGRSCREIFRIKRELQSIEIV